jgi:hypothetical protein
MSGAPEQPKADKKKDAVSSLEGVLRTAGNFGYSVSSVVVSADGGLTVQLQKPKAPDPYHPGSPEDLFRRAAEAFDGHIGAG